MKWVWFENATVIYMEQWKSNVWLAEYLYFTLTRSQASWHVGWIYAFLGEAMLGEKTWYKYHQVKTI